MKNNTNNDIDAIENTEPIKHVGDEPKKVEAKAELKETLPDGEKPATPPNNYFIPSIIATVLCCPPTGVWGIINAARVERLFRNQQYTEAEKCSKTAYKWIKISIAIWVVFVIIFTIIAIKSSLTSPFDIIE